MFENSIFLSVILSLTLVSCAAADQTPVDNNPKPIPAPPPAPEPGKPKPDKPKPVPAVPVSGKVSVGTGAGTVELKLGKSKTVVATGKVSSDGKFTIGVPNGGKEVENTLSAGANLLKDLGCEGSFKLSKKSLKTTAFRGVSLKRGKKNIKVYHSNSEFHWFPPTSKFRSRVYIYADQAAKINGRLECAKFLDKPDSIKSINTKVDISLNRGWNVVQLRGETSGVSMPVDATATLKNSSLKNGDYWLTLAQLDKKGRP